MIISCSNLIIIILKQKNSFSTGALASSEEIFIKEAGEHCRRDIDPYRYSMQLNKTNACPKTETKMDVPPSSRDDDKDKSSTASSPDETIPSNGEVEYEYFDNDNHLNMNSGNAVSSSTDSKVQIHTKDGVAGDTNQNTIGDTISFQSIHPKLDLGRTTKIDNKTSTPNRSDSQRSNFNSILLSLFVVLLLPTTPNLFIH